MFNFLNLLKLLIFIILKPQKFITAIFVIFTEGSKEFRRRIKINYYKSNFAGLSENLYVKWFEKNYPSENQLFYQKKQSKLFKYLPKISIIIPTYNTPEQFLHECLQSVLKQSYPNWEICIADDNSENENIRKILIHYADIDNRIKYTFNTVNNHISATTNAALKLSSGDFVGFLDHDDILWPNALYEIVKLLNDNSKLDFIYTDEDKLSENGEKHFNPSFKPDWNPDYLRSANYIVHFTIIRHTLVKKLGGLQTKYDGAQDWDLYLRATRLTNRIYHIPKVLYSWRVSKTSTASDGSAKKIKSYAFANQEGVLMEDLISRGYQGEVLPTKLLGIWRVKYRIKETPLISIIIPNKDKITYIKNCLQSILEKTTYKNFELIIVDTGSEDKKVFDLYKKIKVLHKETTILQWKKEFNFSKVCNFGASKSTGRYLLFLNNDTKVISPDWVENMLEHAQRKEVGAVGCKLLFPNLLIQHVGVILGIKNDRGESVVAGHSFRGLVDHHPSTHLIDSIRNYSAVTGACLMVAKDKFNQVKGFDPKYRIAFNDIDFCLKLLKHDYVNVYTPFSILYHHESVSVGHLNEKKRDVNEFKKEIEQMHRSWGKMIENDPAYNINLTNEREDFSIRNYNE